MRFKSAKFRKKMTLSTSMDILVALERLDLQLCFDVIREIANSEDEFDLLKYGVQNRSEELRSLNDDEFPVDLTEEMDDQDYVKLVQEIDSVNPNLASKIDRVLYAQRLQQELSIIRNESYDEYLQSLPLISSSQIADAIRRGLLVSSEDELGKAEGRRTDEDCSGAFPGVPLATARVEASTLVSVLSKFCSPATYEIADPKGLGISQVLIQGELDLNWINSPFPLRFEGCEFDSSVSADGFSAPALSFDTCTFTSLGYSFASEPELGGFNATRMHIKNKLSFFGCINVGQLFLLDCRIGSFIPLSDVFDEGNIGHHCRIVLSGTKFDELEVSEYSKFKAGFGSHLKGVRLGSIAVYPEEGEDDSEYLLQWLDSQNLDGRPTRKAELDVLVSDEVEDSLRRSGNSELARQFGIKAADYQTRFEGVIGVLKRWFLGSTVRYFYDNLRAIWMLVGLWVLTYLIVLGLSYIPEAYKVSPSVANAEIPFGWISSGYNRFVWALLYSLDLVISPLSLGQTQILWPSCALVALLFSIIKGLSLAFFALFVTGVTGVTSRRGN